MIQKIQIKTLTNGVLLDVTCIMDDKNTQLKEFDSEQEALQAIQEAIGFFETDYSNRKMKKEQYGEWRNMQFIIVKTYTFPK
jgi:predicted nuclease of restriction endonuclease-like RecB superfamily